MSAEEYELSHRWCRVTGTAFDPTTAERIAFDFNGPDCHCLTLEEHMYCPARRA